MPLKKPKDFTNNWPRGPWMDATKGRRPEEMQAAMNWAALVRQFHELGGDRRASSIADFMGGGDRKHLMAVLNGEHWPQIDFVCRLAAALGRVVTLDKNLDGAVVPHAEKTAPPLKKTIRWESEPDLE